MRFLPLALLLGCAGLPPAATDVKPHALFSDHMVLQQGRELPVWGTATPGGSVTVSIAGRSADAVAGTDGRWKAILPPLTAGGPHELSIGPATLKNVMVGEVWVCSGQSNMEWSVKASANPDSEIGNSKDPDLRLFTVPRKTADTPQRAVDGSWKVCGPDTVAGFSAVAYYFGRELRKKLGVPVGLVHSSWGGTAAELWTRKEVLDRLFISTGGRPKMAPSSLYNGMIAPIIPYAMAGVIWYQGESNAGRANQYRTLFPAMIQNWRDDWDQGDFPFLFVQLANFMARKPEPSESNWAALREAQTMTLSVPRTGMAVAIDIGDAKDIHPKNKQEVGRRLSLAARAIAYGEDVVHSGPIYQSMKVDGPRIRLSFRNLGSGLMAKGDPLTGFSIAGADGKFVWADARIEGSQVLVWSDRVPEPKAVRYAWADNPECNLYNKEGLPASPFRTE